MRKIDSSKIWGIRIWIDEENAHEIEAVSRDTDRTRRMLEFKSYKEFDDFIKLLKEWKKDIIEFYKKDDDKFR